MKLLFAVAVGGFLLLVCLMPGIVVAFDGPLPIKNQFPLSMYLLSPRYESPRLQDSLTLGLTYSSIYMVRKSRDYNVGLDLESAEFSLGLRKVILDSIELSAEVPVVVFTSGIMDDAINKYHEALGFGNYGRRNRPLNAFLFSVKEKGKTLIEGRDGYIGLGDIRLGIKTPLLTSDPLISVMLELELPTGSNPGAGIGSGGVDAGGSIMVGKDITNNLSAYGAVGVVFPGNYRGRETIGLRSYLHATTALQYDLSRPLLLIGQLTVQGAAFPDTQIPQIDRPAALFAIGARYKLDKNTIELSFIEDPNTSGAPDFSLNLLYKAVGKGTAE
ncbi:conserved hypothetical protein, secreted [Candidatus Magnetobacterium bavaricum]|uniref:DUF3187 family protein n=1 Tax=Candidatus Magnetobacterium bavaricum TaxID=29290 RepID=A0A0F3GQ85_9BACT|nr:conserved hypothetical protein, secreted [Candidatus Magnetobacterium bavaricum]